MPFNTDPTRRASSDGAAQAVSDEGAPNKANSAKPLPDRSDIADATASQPARRGGGPCGQLSYPVCHAVHEPFAHKYPGWAGPCRQ